MQEHSRGGHGAEYSRQSRFRDELTDPPGPRGTPTLRERPGPAAEAGVLIRPAHSIDGTGQQGHCRVGDLAPNSPPAHGSERGGGDGGAHGEAGRTGGCRTRVQTAGCFQESCSKLPNPHLLSGVESPSSTRLEVRFPYHGSRAITHSPSPSLTSACPLSPQKQTTIE